MSFYNSFLRLFISCTFHLIILQIFPIFFALMTHKSAECYTDLFKYIENHVFQLQPAQVMTDWESALRLAINNVYPSTDIKGCWFHYCSAIRRKAEKVVKDFHLLKTDKNAYEIYRQLLSIPLLPSEYIEDGYHAVKHKARFDGLFEKFKALFEYYEEQWLKVVCSKPMARTYV